MNLLNKLFILLTVFFGQQYASAECVKEIKDPATQGIPSDQKYRLVFQEDFEIPASNYREFILYGRSEGIVQNGKLLDNIRKSNDGRAYLIKPIPENGRPYCEIGFFSMPFDFVKRSSDSSNCYELNKVGKFCDEIAEPYKLKIKRGYTIDLDVRQWFGGGTIGFQNDHVTTLFWMYDSADEPEKTQIQNKMTNNIYHLMCSQNRSSFNGERLMISDILNAFPPNGVALYLLDDSVEACPSEAK